MKVLVLQGKLSERAMTGEQRHLQWANHVTTR